MQAAGGVATGSEGIFTSIQEVTNWFIPVGIRHSRTQRGLAQIFVQTQLLAAAGSLLMVFYLMHAASEAQVAFYVLCAAAAIFAALPAVLRRTGNMSLVTLISFETLTIASLAGTYDYGGFASPFLPWLLVSLMSGLFYQSRRAGLVLGLFAVGFALFFTAQLWRAPPELVAVGDLQTLSWISIAVAIGYMAFMALYYARVTASKVELELEAERYRRVSLELESAKALAEKVGRDRSMFFAKMSHELRTPLNVVINYSEMLLEEYQDEGTPDPQRMADLGRINATGKHLLSLVSDVFDIDDVERDTANVDVRSFALGELCDVVVANVQPMMERGGCRFIVDCPLRADVVHTDDKKLRQILLNLLSNAAKFAPGGTVTLELWVERGPVDDRLHAGVKDTGVGIAPEALPNLFQAYMQADPATTENYGGTGLGLAITRKFSVLLGGQITVTSRAGEGSHFIVDVPADLTGRVGHSGPDDSAPVSPDEAHPRSGVVGSVMPDNMGDLGS